MASERMNLYDSDFLGWYRVATDGDISDLKTKLNDHEIKLINSETGIHGIRVWNGKLQQTNDNGITWVDVVTESGNTVTVVDNLLSESSSDALSAKQGKVLDGKITTLTTSVNANTQAITNKADNVLATNTSNGLFSSAEKIKLASLSTDIEPITVEDVLTSNSTENALSANQGRVLSTSLSTLDDYVKANVIVGGVGVTQTEKDAWNAKSEFSGSYTDLSNKPTIPTLNNTLTSTSTTEGLTANQGYLLDSKITSLKTTVEANTLAISNKANNTLATDTENGLFSSAEKIKLASLISGGSSVTVENVLTSDSTTNALSAKMGKDLKALVDGKASQADFTSLQTYVNTNVPVGGVIVTQTEKNAWTAKSDFSGSYNDLTNKPTIPAATVLNNTTSSTSTTEAATANAVKVTYDKAVEALNKEVTKTEVGLSNVDDVKQMPISNGTFESYTEKIVPLSSGTVNLSLGNVFTHTLSANVTYSFTNAKANTAHSFTLFITQGTTARTITFPSSVKWQTVPDVSVPAKTYIISFISVNGGSTWYGVLGGVF